MKLIIFFTYILSVLSYIYKCNNAINNYYTTNYTYHKNKNSYKIYFNNVLKLRYNFNDKIFYYLGSIYDIKIYNRNKHLNAILFYNKIEKKYVYTVTQNLNDKNLFYFNNIITSNFGGTLNKTNEWIINYSLYYSDSECNNFGCFPRYFIICNYIDNEYLLLYFITIIIDKINP
jgi:hypothetical protein